MNPGQKMFYEFFMERVPEGKEEGCHGPFRIPSIIKEKKDEYKN